MKIDDIMNEDIEEVASESFTERVRLSKEELAESAKRAGRGRHKDFAPGADEDDEDYRVVFEDEKPAEAEKLAKAEKPAKLEKPSKPEKPAKDEKLARAAAAKKSKYEDPAEDEEYDDEAAEAYEYDLDGDGEFDEESGDGGDVSEEDIEEDAKENGSKSWSWVKELVFFLGCFIVIYAIFYVFPPYLVSGSSMNKTLTDKAFGFGFRYTTPERGDIVILNTGDKQNGTDNSNFIKRVIGVPGDTISCVWETYDHAVVLSDGTIVPPGEKVYRVYINGVLEEAPYTYYQGGSYAPTGEWTLKENEFFVMGDNRFNSHDSRIIGPVTKDEIVCKMLFFLWGKHD